MVKAKKILRQEKRQTWRIRLGKMRRAYCELCGRETDWLTAAQAAVDIGLTEREVFRLTDKAEIHSMEIEAGLLLICRRSLESFH